MWRYILLSLTLTGVSHATHESQAAKSLTTAEFKSAFRDSGIVPEILPATLDPSVSFYVSYKSPDGKDGQILPGTKLTVQETKFPFEFSVENLQNVTNVTSASRYLIYLLDADAPSRSDPSARNFRHYLGGNFTLSGSNSSVLASAQILRNTTLPFNEFVQPNPSSNTGEHRYIFALYVQPAKYDRAGFDSVGMSQDRSNWNLSQWRTQLGLGPAIGATYYTINTSPNAQSVAPAVHGNGLATLAFGALSLACLSLVL